MVNHLQAKYPHLSFNMYHNYPMQLSDQGVALNLNEFQTILKNESAGKTFEECVDLYLKHKDDILVSLSQPEHRQSTAPICQACPCHLCKNFNRAYIHHLLDVKEINANILLNMHNLMQYQLFIEYVNNS